MCPPKGMTSYPSSISSSGGHLWDKSAGITNFYPDYVVNYNLWYCPQVLKDGDFDVDLWWSSGELMYFYAPLQAGFESPKLSEIDFGNPAVTDWAGWWQDEGRYLWAHNWADNLGVGTSIDGALGSNVGFFDGSVSWKKAEDYKMSFIMGMHYIYW